MTHKVNSGCGYSPTKSSHSLVAVAAATVVVVYYIMLTSICEPEREREREHVCMFAKDVCPFLVQQREHHSIRTVIWNCLSYFRLK